jgi:Fe-S-cluster containining protein
MFVDSAPPLEMRLDLKDNFYFDCRRELPCFNSCCSNKHLPLTPYDILRIKKALNIDSDLFLAEYTNYRLDQESGFPVISINMENGDEKNCPFVTPEGCSIYKDRPMACRLFPLGRVSGFAPGNTVPKEIYYLLKVRGCAGVDELKSQSVEEWVEGQGLGRYIEMNDLMLDILFHPRKKRDRPLDGKQLQKVIVACYNLDVFRNFVFETKFMDLYDIDKDTRERVKEDDIVLLKLGVTYLKQTLYTQKVIDSIRSG